MNKLADIEKKFKAEKFYKEDQNREFVLQKSNNFLKTISSSAANIVEEVPSSESSGFHLKKAKQTKMFIIDSGQTLNQT